MKRFLITIISGALMGLAYEYLITPYIGKPIDDLAEKVVTGK
jgi:hypothetical protein